MVIAAVLLAGSAALYYETTRFDEVPAILAGAIAPEFFPRLLLWLIGLLALLMPVEHRFVPGAAERLRKGREAPVHVMCIRTYVVLVLVVTAMPLVGMALSMVVASLALPLLWGERRWKYLVPFAIFFPTLLTVLFAKILEVYFDPGLIGFSLA